MKRLSPLHGMEASQADSADTAGAMMHVRGACASLSSSNRAVHGGVNTPRSKMRQSSRKHPWGWGTRQGGAAAALQGLPYPITHSKNASDLRISGLPLGARVNDLLTEPAASQLLRPTQPRDLPEPRPHRCDHTFVCRLRRAGGELSQLKELQCVTAQRFGSTWAMRGPAKHRRPGVHAT